MTRPLTHEERLPLITKYFPIMTVYTGKIWGGVQVVDRLMRSGIGGEDDTPTLGHYQGPDVTTYADSADVELLNVLDLLTPDEQSDIHEFWQTVRS